MNEKALFLIGLGIVLIAFFGCYFLGGLLIIFGALDL